MSTSTTQLSDTSVAFIFSSLFLQPGQGRDTTPCLATSVPVNTQDLAVLLHTLALMTLTDRGCVTLQPFEERRALRTVRGIRVHHRSGEYAPGLEGTLLQALLRRRGAAAVHDLIRDVVPECYQPFSEACGPTVAEVVAAGYATSVPVERSLKDRLAGRPATALQPIQQLYPQLQSQLAPLQQNWRSAYPHTEALRAAVRKAISSRTETVDPDSAF
jgi:hypothetical protein